MSWLIPLIGLLSVLPLVSGFYVEIGQWAFRHQKNGAFSEWQIAGQIFILGIPALGCLIALIWYLMDFVQRLIGG